MLLPWDSKAPCRATGRAGLRNGTATSCGCYQRDHARALNLHHGESKRGTKGERGTPRYEMWGSSKERATRKKLPFNLTLDDIQVPKTCPVLGISLRPGAGKTAPDSPSLDRIIPEVGYVKGNVRVISSRANTLKSDATLDEIRKIVEYMETNKCP